MQNYPVSSPSTDTMGNINKFSRMLGYNPTFYYLSINIKRQEVMNNNSIEIVSILESHKALITDENVHTFMATLEQLKIVKADASLLNRLMTILTDDVEDIFPFDNLVDYIISQDYNLVIEAVMNQTPQMIRKAKGWLVMLYIFILTRDENQNMLVENYKKITGNTKNVVTEFLQSLAFDLASHPPKTELDMQGFKKVQKTISFIFKNSDNENL
jgi:hypothetical protein